MGWMAERHHSLVALCRRPLRCRRRGVARAGLYVAVAARSARRGRLPSRRTGRSGGELLRLAGRGRIRGFCRPRVVPKAENTRKIRISIVVPNHYLQFLLRSAQQIQITHFPGLKWPRRSFP